jgi:7-cyano-7-deazaguanine synthase
VGFTVPHAVVLLSGGLDSATTLAIARSEGFSCHCLTIDYGQRHCAELAAAARVAEALGAAEHQVLTLDLTTFGGSALTDASIEVPLEGVQPGIPLTYVPARNTIFLSLALAYAEVRDAADIFFGANAVDYSGYPDCRPEYMRAFEALANLATKAAIEGRRLTLRTPIIEMSKADIIRRGATLGVDYSLTVSCYQADGDGRACGLCDACRIRRAGFETAGLPDPTRYLGRVLK